MVGRVTDVLGAGRATLGLGRTWGAELGRTEGGLLGRIELPEPRDGLGATDGRDELPPDGRGAELDPREPWLEGREAELPADEPFDPR